MTTAGAHVDEIVVGGVGPATVAEAARPLMLSVKTPEAGMLSVPVPPMATTSLVPNDPNAGLRRN
jgi:hypothetical protein